MLSESLPGIANQLGVVGFERLCQAALKKSGECPKRCLLSRQQHIAELARVFPAMEQVEQDQGFI